MGRVRLWRRLGSVYAMASDVDLAMDHVWAPNGWWGIRPLRMPRRPGARMALPPARLVEIAGPQRWEVLAYSHRLEAHSTLPRLTGGGDRRRTDPLHVLDQIVTEQCEPPLDGWAEPPGPWPFNLPPWRLGPASYLGVVRRSRTDPLARWSIDLLGLDAMPRVRLEGRWITLAWIGHLNGWPPPPLA